MTRLERQRMAHGVNSSMEPLQAVAFQFKAELTMLRRRSEHLGR